MILPNTGINITVTFQTSAGVAFTPMTASFTWRDPDEIDTTYTLDSANVTNTSTGVYVLYVVPTKSGVYRLKAASTASGQEVTGETSVQVGGSKFS